MYWIVGAAVVAGGIAIIACRRYLREQQRILAHARQLRPLLQRARADDPAPLRSHALDCHEHHPGRAAAEAWFVLGCALLDACRPEEATRPFQLACHAAPGLSSAVLLAFSCLKTRHADMPNLLRILLETYEEIGRPAIPGSAWERAFLAGIHQPDVSRVAAGSLIRSLLSLPIQRVCEQAMQAVNTSAASLPPLPIVPAPGAKAR